MPLRVLEIGDCAAGYAGKLFARWGAEVIRVDLPDREPDYPQRIEHDALDIYLHAGKRRAAIDYRQQTGRSLLDRLAALTDILIADLDAADLDRLAWEELGGAALKVRAAITPFGLTGPKRDWVATSNVLLAMGGLTYLMGDPDRAPLTMPGRYLYYQAGQYAYTAALASYRLRPADPQTIDVSVYETAMSLHQFTTVMWTFNGRIRSRHGNNFGVIHPITMYPCKDGWYAVNADATFWDAFTIMLDMPELIEDPRFDTMLARVANAEALDEIVHRQLGDKTCAEILELGQRVCRMPTGVLASIDDLLNDEHLGERHFWQTLEVNGEAVKMPGSAFNFLGEERPAQPTPQSPIAADALADEFAAKAGG